MKAKKDKREKTKEEIVNEWVENELKYEDPEAYERIKYLEEKQKDINFIIEGYKQFAELLRGRGRTEQQIKDNIKKLIEENGYDINVEDIFR
jgi:hypothetical protein